MATISAQMVKELRDKTGAGMMDCKTALNESDADMEAAIDWLRAKGLSKAAKKASRVASEGLIGSAIEGQSGTLVEVNSETDFVARNDQFQALVSTIAKVAREVGGDADAVAAAAFPGEGKSVDAYLKEMIATIGENMSLRRAAHVTVKEGVVAFYAHNAVAPGLGKIGVLVGLESSGDQEKLMALGKQIAMHVAAARPLAISEDQLDQDIVAREKAILSEQARQSGKPENIIEKMVEGRIRKFFEEVLLLSQIFVVDGENTIAKVLEQAKVDIGAEVKISAFQRYELGEGIEKKQEDFAAEVAAVAGE